MGMSREERKIYHGKQTKDTGGQGTPTTASMDEGLGIFRSTANGVVQYVRLNGVLYESTVFIRKAPPITINDYTINWGFNEPTVVDLATIADGDTIGDDNDAAESIAALTAKLNLILAALRRYGIISARTATTS